MCGSRRPGPSTARTRCTRARTTPPHTSILHTDAGEGLSGHGLTFTCGRGNEVCVAGIRALEPLVVGRRLEGITGDLRAFWRSLVSDGQLRWIGPEKGAMHMAVGAVVNAVWDLWAKNRGVPLWRLLLDLVPEELVAAIDFRYIDDALRSGGGSRSPSREGRRARGAGAGAPRTGYPAYTTSAGGWATTTKRWRPRRPRDRRWVLPREDEGRPGSRGGFPSCRP